MAFPAFSSLFGARAVDLARSAVAFAGGQRQAARLLDIPISTLRSWVTGEVRAPLARSIADLATTFRELPGQARWQLQAGVDFFEQLTPEEQRRAYELAREDPQGYRDLLGRVEQNWVRVREGREEAGEPPLETGSP